MKSSRIERRLRNEVEKARDAGIEAVLYMDTDAGYHRYVATVNARSLGTLVLKYPADYPFRPPKVDVNGKSYDRFLRLCSHRFIRLYNQLFSGVCSCVCHRSILSSEKWNPSFFLADIVADLSRLHHDKCFVAYRLQAEKIKERHGLPEEIDISSFL
jgi:hypothetical protein